MSETEQHIVHPRAVPVRAAAVRTAAGLSWTLLWGATRRFVLDDLREGMISLAGLPQPTRALIRLGFALLLAMLGIMLLDEPWRGSSQMITLGSSLATSGRGALVPVAAIPLTFTLLAIAWSFLLTGAMHAGRALKLTVLTVYLALAGGWIHASSAGLNASNVHGVAVMLLAPATTYALLFSVPLLFWMRRRSLVSPALEFLLLLLLVSGTLLIAEERARASWVATGSPVLSVLLQLCVAQMTSLVLPLIVALGVNMAMLTRQVGTWSADVVSERLPPRGVQYVVCAALLWRGWEVAQELRTRVQRESAPAELLQYLHAASMPLLVLLVWYVVAHRGRGGVENRAPGDEVFRTSPSAELSGELSWIDELATWVRRSALLLVVIYGAVQIALVGMTTLLAALPRTPGVIALSQRWLAVTGAGTAETVWQIGVDLVTVAVALTLVRRRRGLALYLLLLATWHLWTRAVEPGAVLSRLGWSGPEPEDFWVVTILAAFTIVWTARGSLSPERATGLLALLVMSWLLRRIALMDDPYSPFFLGYGGIGFIAFGILYDAATTGGWANAASPRLPRVARVLLYTGYVLVTVTAVNWVVTTHDLTTLGRFTGDGAAVGLERFGKPFLFAVFALSLGALARTPRLHSTTTDPLQRAT